jgi:hypothetical protein
MSIPFEKIFREDNKMLHILSKERQGDYYG